MRFSSAEDVVWPAEMTLTIDEFPEPLMQLLYVRYAWRLRSWISEPVLNPEPERGRSAIPASSSREEAEAAWETAWTKNVYWNYRAQGDYSDEFDPASEYGIRGPSWWFRDRGTDGIDTDAYQAWTSELDALRVRAFNSPERLALAEAIRAWQNGLRTIYVMPYEKVPGAEWIGVHIMNVSARTRLDSGMYPAALTSQPA